MAKVQTLRGWVLIACVLVAPTAYAQSVPIEDPEAPLPANALRPSSPVTVRTAGIVTPISNIKVGSQRVAVTAASIATNVKNLLADVRGLRVDENEIELRIILESDVLFDFDRWELRPEATKSLTAVAQALGQFKGRSIRLIGHTDSKGDDGYNQKLSLKRAASVKQFFAAQSTLRGFKFNSEGKGEREPAVANSFPDGRDDPAGRQKNRRVEIRIPKLP